MNESRQVRCFQNDQDNLSCNASWGGFCFHFINAMRSWVTVKWSPGVTNHHSLSLWTCGWNPRLKCTGHEGTQTVEFQLGNFKKALPPSGREHTWFPGCLENHPGKRPALRSSALWLTLFAVGWHQERNCLHCEWMKEVQCPSGWAQHELRQIKALFQQGGENEKTHGLDRVLRWWWASWSVSCGIQISHRCKHQSLTEVRFKFLRVLATSCKPMKEKLNLMNEVSFTSGEGMMAMNHVNDDSAVKDAWSVTTG